MVKVVTAMLGIYLGYALEKKTQKYMDHAWCVNANMIAIGARTRGQDMGMELM